MPASRPPPPYPLPAEEWLWEYARSVPDKHVQRKIRFLELRWAGSNQGAAADALAWNPSPAAKFERDYVEHGAMAVRWKKGTGAANWHDNPDPENLIRRIRELHAAGADLTDANARVAFTSLH